MYDPRFASHASVEMQVSRGKDKEATVVSRRELGTVLQ